MDTTYMLFSQNHLRYLRIFRFPHILASFLKLNDFTIDLFAKKLTLSTFSSLELIFPGNSVDFAFSFRLYSSEQKNGIRGNF